MKGWEKALLRPKARKGRGAGSRCPQAFRFQLCWQLAQPPAPRLPGDEAVLVHSLVLVLRRATGDLPKVLNLICFANLS